VNKAFMGQHWEMRLHPSYTKESNRLQWSEKGKEDMRRKRELLIVVSLVLVMTVAILPAISETLEGLTGKYQGYLPCADCPGIEYALALNEDGTYSESLFYTDRSKRAIVNSGTFTVEGEVVILNKRDRGMKYFARHPQGLMMLDNNRNVVAGDLSERYILSRKAQYGAAMQNTDTLKLMQKKMAEGIDFYAVGNEPSWSVDIDFDKFMRFKSLTELPEMHTPPGKEDRAQDADVTRYFAQTESGTLIVTVLKGKCSDTMSGEPILFRVRVDVKRATELDYTSFEGCGVYVVDYRLNDIWVLTMFNHKPLNKEDFAKGLPMLEFHLNDNRVFGSTGCNRMTGGFEVRGNKITFSQMATTRMACPNMEFENRFLKALTGGTLNYSLDRGRLMLKNDEGITLEFKKTD